MCNNINFKTARYKLTYLSTIKLSIFNYNLMKAVSFLWLPIELKKRIRRKQQTQKEIEREKYRSIPKKEPLNKNFSIFNQFFNGSGIVVFLTI